MARETVTRADLDGAAAELDALLRGDLNDSISHGIFRVDPRNEPNHYVVVLDNGEYIRHLSEPGTAEEALAFLKAMTLGAEYALESEV
tara:strand:+ start:14969 stop:15232 length:264 start_codon:yes stop_codon:yes gene_type:complete